MSNQRRESAAPVEPYFDRTPQPFGDAPPDPLVYDASPRMLRQRTVNFAAKRLADMRYVSGLDRATAERHFRWRPAVPPGGLGFRAAPDGQAELVAAQRRGDIVVEMDDADRRVTSAGTTPVSASRLSAPRLPGPAMAASSWARRRAWVSIRNRSPVGDRSPDTPGRSAMSSRRRPTRLTKLPARSMASSPARRAPTAS